MSNREEKIFMTQAVQIFNNPEFGDVRVVELEGEIFFVGRDVAIALGYAKPENALAAHVPSKYKKVTPIQGTLGGTQNMTVINEAGLYKLVMRSKLPNAEKFSDWTCEEVLPSIRKHGVYMTVETAEKILYNPDFIIGLAQQVKDANAKIAELQPKADYCEKVLESDEHLTSELIAKEYGEHAQWLHEKLSNLGKIYKRGRHWFMKAPYAREGYRDSETKVLERGRTVVTHYWTQKGRRFIYNTLKKIGIVPLTEHNDAIVPLFKEATT